MYDFEETKAKELPKGNQLEDSIERSFIRAAKESSSEEEFRQKQNRLFAQLRCR